jgi:CBS-domain-containing membrane protein
MRRSAPTIGPEAPIREAVALITKARARHLPVIEHDKVIGLLSVGDLLACRLDETVQENLILREVARWPQAQSA